MKYRLKDIYDLCDYVSPFDTQESWDKSGLNLGSFDDAFKEIVVCLEINLDIAQKLKPDTLVLTHHPLFFKAFSAFYTHKYPANIAKVLLGKNCSLISLHTNFDKSHLNAYLTHQVLRWEHFVPNGLFMCGSIEAMTLEELAHYVCAALNARSVNFTQGDISSTGEKSIKDIYVLCGSGCSMLDSIPSSPTTCFITSDVKHHDAMSAKSMGISLIDMGHYESEKYFVEIIDSILKNAGYKCIIADCENPFSLCLNKRKDILK